MSTRIIIVPATPWRTIASDSLVYGCWLGMLYTVNPWIPADRQWIAASIALVAITVRSVTHGRKWMTVDEARAELDRLEAEARP